jgi:hypothetical protein
MVNSEEISKLSDPALAALLEEVRRAAWSLPQPQLDLIDAGDETMVGVAGRDFLLVLREVVRRALDMPPELRSDVAAQLAAIRLWFSYKTPNLLRTLEPQLNLIRDRNRSWHDNRSYRERQAKLNLVRKNYLVHPDDVQKLEDFAASLLRDRNIEIPKLPVGRKPKAPTPPELKRPRGRPRKDSYTTIITPTGVVNEIDEEPDDGPDFTDAEARDALKDN